MPDSLGSLVARIAACRICVDTPIGTPLPHEPRPVLRISSSARIVVCGQAPGTRVHASGVPFSDPSGDRLRSWLGLTSDVFYDKSRIAIVPMGFCFPGLDAKGGDKPPRPECAAAWRSEVFAHLPDLRLLLLVGQYAQRWHLRGACARTLTETVGNWRMHYAAQTPCILPLPHPSWRNTAWIRKNPWFESELVPALRQTVADVLGPRPRAALYELEKSSRK